MSEADLGLAADLGDLETDHRAPPLLLVPGEGGTTFENEPGDLLTRVGLCDQDPAKVKVSGVPVCPGVLISISSTLADVPAQSVTAAWRTGR